MNFTLLFLYIDENYLLNIFTIDSFLQRLIFLIKSTTLQLTFTWCN